MISITSRCAHPLKVTNHGVQVLQVPSISWRDYERLIKLPWGLLLTQVQQNFCCTSTITDGQFKAKTSKFCQRWVGEGLLRDFVTPGRSYKDPSRVLKTKIKFWKFPLLWHRLWDSQRRYFKNLCHTFIYTHRVYLRVCWTLDGSILHVAQLHATTFVLLPRLPAPGVMYT